MLIPLGRHNRKAPHEQPDQGLSRYCTRDNRRLLTLVKVASASQFNAVIFKNKAEAPLGSRLMSLFPGLGYAAAYKVKDEGRTSGAGPDSRDRCCSECTSMVDSHSCATTSRGTTATPSTGHLAEATARPLCTPLLEGRWHHEVAQQLPLTDNP